MFNILHKCQSCGITFKVKSSEESRGRGIFCGRKCMSKRKKTKYCIICKKQYSAIGGNAFHQRYCSPNCRYVGQARNIANGKDIVNLYKNGYSLNKLRQNFGISQISIRTLIIENGISVRSAAEERKMMQKIGVGRWWVKKMAPCKMCGSPFYSKLNKRYCSVSCAYKDPDTKDRMRNMALKQLADGKIVKSNTKIEQKVKNFLIEQNIPFKHQYIVGFWSFDFYIPERTLVEVDGDYWHGNPEIFKILNETQVNNIKNDRRKEDFATKMGYKIVRFWGSDITNEWDTVKNELLNVVKNG